MKKIDFFEAAADVGVIDVPATWMPGNQAILLIIKPCDNLKSAMTKKEYPQRILEFFVKDGIKPETGMVFTGRQMELRHIKNAIIQETIQIRKRSKSESGIPKGYFWGSFRCVIEAMP